MYIRMGDGKTATFLDYTPYYGITNGAISISGNFDGTTHSMTATFTLQDPPTTPSELQIVEIFQDKNATQLVFSGVVREVSRTVVGAHDSPSPTVFNGATITITADSWELASGSRGELILYESYYSKTVNYIIASIVAKYMPHLNTQLIDVGAGTVLEKVIFQNRKPTDAIIDLCKMAGIAWAVKPKKVTTPTGATGQIFLFTPGTSDYVSPISIDDTVSNSEQKQRKIELQVANNLDDLINDLYLKGEGIKSELVQEVIDVNGWEGTYVLEHSPHGVEKSIVVNDEFNSDEVEAPDTGTWTYNGYVGINKNIYLGAGRLYLGRNDTSKSASLVSKQLVHTRQPLKARNLEISLRNVTAGHYYAFGLHTGETQATPDISKIVLGVQLKYLDLNHAQIYLIKNGVASTIGDLGDYTVDITGGGAEKPYQFIIKLFDTTTLTPFTEISGWPVTGNVQYQIWVNGGEYGDLSKPANRILTSGTLDAADVPKFVAYSPVVTSGGVEGSVIQGQLTVEPEIIAVLNETVYISKCETVNAQYVLTCPHANWHKYDLRGLTCWVSGSVEMGRTITDPITVQTQIVAHTDSTITVTSVGTIPPENVYKLEIDWRRLEVGLKDTNDYTTHMIVTPDESKPTVQFYADEVPTGRIWLYYCADKKQTARVTNLTSVQSAQSKSCIPYDLGYRKKFEQTDKAISTLGDMLTYGSEYVQSTINSLVQGTVETCTYLAGGNFIYAGMTQPVNIHVGRETITANTYISSITSTDVGAYQFTQNLSLGGLTTFFQEQYIAKVKKLYSSGLVIDDTDEDAPKYELEKEIGGTNPKRSMDVTVGSPLVYRSDFTSEGIQLEWIHSTGATEIELRTDTVPGSTGSGLLYKGTNLTYTIPYASINRRKYTFYLYDIKTVSGVKVYSMVPTVCTVNNLAPVPSPYEDVYIDPSGLITLVMGVPYGNDITKRVVVVSNEVLNDEDLKNYLTSDKVDMYFELVPQHFVDPRLKIVSFTAYDQTLYAYHFDLDAYSHLDTKYTHFDRTFTAGCTCKPPKPPTYTLIDRTTDPSLGEDQFRLEISKEISQYYGDPEVFHVQLNLTPTWPSPILRAVTGKALVTSAKADYFFVPTGQVFNSDIGFPVALLRTFTVEDGATQNWTQTTFLTNVEYYGLYEGVDCDKVTVDRPLCMDKGLYDWALYDKWYLNCYDYQNFDVSTKALSVVSDKYAYVFTRTDDFKGYVRLYALNRYGYVPIETSGQVETNADVDVPGAPVNVSFVVDGYNITVTWEPPASNANSLDCYYVVTGTKYLSTNGVFDGISNAKVTYVAGSARECVLNVTNSGEYAIGVRACNRFGTGPYGFSLGEIV